MSDFKNNLELALGNAKRLSKKVHWKIQQFKRRLSVDHDNDHDIESLITTSESSLT